MVNVRMAKTDDAESILNITKEAFADYVQLAGISDTAALHEDIDTIINDINTKAVYVACVNDTVVGSVRIKKTAENTAYLSRFGVSNEHQNLGIGKTLIDAVDADMFKSGIKFLELHTASKAASLIHFYYNRGFYIDSTSKDMGYVRAKMVKEY